METDAALGWMAGMLWRTMIVAGPILAAALLVGLLISIVQVATQLQEMTLSYVPKLLVSALLLILLGPWMVGQMTGFARDMFAMIPTLG